jgi:hypothetical protein
MPFVRTVRCRTYANKRGAVVGCGLGDCGERHSCSRLHESPHQQDGDADIILDYFRG